MLLFSWCFMALRHVKGHFERVQLTYPHCSWAWLLSSLPVLSAHSFASNWQLPFLKQRKREKGQISITKCVLDVRIEPTTVRRSGGYASDRATAKCKEFVMECIGAAYLDSRKKHLYISYGNHLEKLRNRSTTETISHCNVINLVWKLFKNHTLAA